MSDDLRQRAWVALSTPLRDQLSPGVVDRFIGGSHTQRFADNLLPGFTAAQVEAVRLQLARGAGGELDPSPSGKRRAHAPYSSAALAANAFGRWIGSERHLEIGGICGFDHTLSLEHKLRIAHGGGEANLDCVLRGPDVLVGIESKLTETLSAHDPVRWRAPYRTPEMHTLLTDGWAEVLDASLAKAWTPVYLGLEQLIKHALALTTHAEGRIAHLVYCYWAPLNGADIPEVHAHQQEAERLQARVGNASPCLHILTYQQLFAEWDELASQLPWLSEHLTQLRRRYAIHV
jgi:hypothetical protein